MPPIIWEIRRERRTELVYEGIRLMISVDGANEYADMVLNPKLNLGAWVDKERYVEWYNEENPDEPLTVESLKNILLDREGTAGYIKPIQDPSFMRVYAERITCIRFQRIRSRCTKQRV